LNSPYVFSVTHLARFRTLDDRDKEMGPLLFGLVGHDVLKAFGESDQADSTEAKDIAAFLRAALDAECQSRFGRDPLPAVQLQIRQLAYRLDLFARQQARRRADGWRIQHVEWAPPDSVPLDVDDGVVALTGRIDRIDRNESGRWSILDYKFGEKAKGPKAVHQRGGDWVDVQLPLYAHLAREVIGPDVPELGYFNLAATGQESGIKVAKEFDADTCASALDAARQVVREVREQLALDEPQFALGQPRFYDPILADLCGQGLLSMANDEEEDE
jgi:RecB family exonuclease